MAVASLDLGEIDKTLALLRESHAKLNLEKEQYLDAYRNKSRSLTRQIDDLTVRRQLAEKFTSFSARELDVLKSMQAVHLSSIPSQEAVGTVGAVDKK